MAEPHCGLDRQDGVLRTLNSAEGGMMKNSKLGAISLLTVTGLFGLLTAFLIVIFMCRSLPINVPGDSGNIIRKRQEYPIVRNAVWRLGRDIRYPWRFIT